MSETGFAQDFSPPRSARSPVPVLVAGGASTIVALVAVYLLEQVGFNAMGFYLDFVVPIGAIGVGLVASSGFALASWRSGTRISGALLVAVTAMLVAAYFLASYLEFRLLYPGGAQLRDGTPVGFWMYFDHFTRSIAFKDSQGQGGDALGLLGYGVRALEIAGFAGGGVLIPFGLRKLPYCDGCGLYMRTSRLASLTTGIAEKLIGDKSPERQEQRRALAEQAQQGMDALFAAAAQGGEQLRAAAAPHAPKRRAFSPPSWVEVSLVHCRSCRAGRLEAATMVRKGNNVVRTALRSAALSPATVEGTLAKDGSHQANSRSVTMTNTGKKLGAGSSELGNQSGEQ